MLFSDIIFLEMLLFTLFLFAFISIPVKSKLDKIELIQDYLKTESSSTVFVIAFMCWDKVSKYKLWNNLFKNNFRATILNFDDNYLKEYNPAQNIRYIIDLDCEKSTEFILKVSSNKLFSAPNKWLLLSKYDEIFINLDRYFATIDILIDSYVVYAFKTQENEYKLFEIYKVNENSSNINQNYLMRWTPTEKFTNFTSKKLWYARKNLQKTAYRACFVITNNETFDHLEDYRSQHIDTPTKLTYFLINHMIDYLNATKEYTFEDSWGYASKGGHTYNGMVGALQHNRADIGGTVLFVTMERIPIIDYIPASIPVRIKFVFRQPPLSYVTNIFTLPFSLGVWISYVGLVLIASTLLYFAVKFEWEQPNLRIRGTVLENSFLEALMFTISGVTQQGYVTEPRSGIGKVIMTLTFLALMFFYVSYSANIVVLLQSSATNIQTLENLLNSRLEVGVDDIVYGRYYFETTTEPIRKAIYEKKVAPQGQKPHFLTMEEGVNRMRQGFYAFHMELGAGYKLVGDTFLESEKCGLQEIQYLQVVDPFVCVRKNSSYKEIVRVGFRKICETGLQSRELWKLYTKKPECNVRSAKFVHVGLRDVYPAFVVLVTGIVLALAISVLEIIVSKKCIFTNKKKKAFSMYS